MKITSQNLNNYTSLTKRPKSGEKDKYQTIINTKIQTKNKYPSYFQSPSKGEDLLFIKKKFQKMKKNSNEKLKNKTTTNNNNSNTHTNISSSYINFMSPINKNYCNQKQNFALTKFLKNKLILNSIDSTSFMTSKEKEMMYNNNSNNYGNLSNILKCNITKNNNLVNNKENIVSSNINSLNNLKLNNNDNNNILCNKNSLSNNNKEISKMVSVDFSSNKICTPESSYNSNHNRIESNCNTNLNKQPIKNMNKNRKNRSSITSINSKNKENTNRDIIKEKNSTKDKDNTNCKTNRKSYRLNFFNNNNNENLNQNKLYLCKGIINTKKNNKNNNSNSNQNLQSNTMFEYNKSQHDNNINFFENYVKAVAMNKNNNNKYIYNNSISINKSSNFNNISNKKNNHNITYNTNNVSNMNTNRETNSNSNNGNKTLFPGSVIHSPKSSNISKTTKSSPKSSLINLNKKIKGHIKNKSISIITKNETPLLFKGNNLYNNENGPISKHNNHKYKMNNNNINDSTTHSKTNSNNMNGNNLCSNYGNQCKNSLSKKLNLIDIGNNKNKKIVSSPYNVYYKKKTQPNSNENTIIHSNKIKMNLSKNNNINTTGNNSKNKNIYINKNHFPNHKNLSCLNNSTQYYYNNMGQNKDSEVSSPTNNNNHQYQKTENIIVNNYNININNQIQNNSFFSNNIITVDSKNGNKNKNNNHMCITNQNNNNITYKQNLKKKKIFSQSLKDILSSNDKNAKNFTTNNSPINKLEILLNTNNNNNIKNNNEINSDNKIDSNNNSNKFTYKKWSSNRDKIRKDNEKKKVFESISSRKKEESKINSKNKMNNNNIINGQRKYIDLKKRITEEMENDTKTKINTAKNGNNKEKEKNFYNKTNENTMNNNRNNELSFSKYNPTLSSRSSTSYDANYFMKESLKLSCYISKYFNKYKKYPDTSLQFYKYGRLIGQGAFGKVNLGLNILTGRIVAVKSFNKNNSELTGENMKKIKYETDLMKKLNHPNITKILEMFEDEKFFLIIMEYINGGNLFSFVKKRRKLSEKTAKFLFRQIILGIKYIHEQNIVHRDIKLENLLIDLNNNVKICDFGIGRKLENKKQLLHDQCGTLMYMAPEILLSSKEKGYEGFPVDIWSAGISLYIMLSGTLPFNYKNKKNHKINEEEEDDDDNEEEEEEFISSSKSKSKKNDDDNFELQYNIVYKHPKHIEKISDEARDLLKGLLNKDPKKRFTCEQILNHPWLYNFKEKNNSFNKFHLFTKAEMIMLSKTFIDYRRANYDDLKENFNLSNLENENEKNNLNEQNITNKSSILAPYNSIISDYDNSSARSIINHKDEDSFDDFNNSKIKLEKDQMVFSKKIKEYNRLYELNNNGEVDNGVLINSKTQSSINMSERSSNNRTENIIKDLDMNLNLNKGSCVIFNENDDDILRVNESKKKLEDIIVKNDNEKIMDEQIEYKIKSNNILSQISIMGYDKKYVLDCVKKNELCHASTVYYLMMNYENI